jgi:(p)ppGpp synthase/HD superfamily hydrolase
MSKSAVFFALRAHAMVVNEFGSLGQRHKYSGTPYENHLLEVANLVQTHGGDPGQIAAAWLHDVVEDTPVTINEIEPAFGSDVASLVLELTDVFTKAAFPELNRAARKQLEAERLWKISARAQTIKFADFVSNGVDIVELAPEFGALYVEEVRNALSGMHLGDSRLRALVERIVDPQRQKGVTA